MKARIKAIDGAKLPFIFQRPEKDEIDRMQEAVARRMTRKKAESNTDTLAYG
jgi:hypothetical protein